MNVLIGVVIAIGGCLALYPIGRILTRAFLDEVNNYFTNKVNHKNQSKNERQEKEQI